MPNGLPRAGSQNSNVSEICSVASSFKQHRANKNECGAAQRPQHPPHSKLPARKSLTQKIAGPGWGSLISWNACVHRSRIQARFWGGDNPASLFFSGGCNENSGKSELESPPRGENVHPVNFDVPVGSSSLRDSGKSAQNQDRMRTGKNIHWEIRNVASCASTQVREMSEETRTAPDTAQHATLRVELRLVIGKVVPVSLSR